MSAPAAWSRRLRARLPRARDLRAGLVLLALAAGGCGGISAASNTVGNQLTVYSSLPLQGASAPISESIVNGEKLALADAGGQVGQFKISYVSLDDSSSVTGLWDPGATSTDAKTAAADKSTIAYLGDFNSGASAISIPLVNAADILQISPGSPYVGLTSAQDAGEDEPDRFYPTGRRTFGRLVPGDQVQGSAQVQLMRTLGVRRVYVLADENAFEAALAAIVAGDAHPAGIAVVGNTTVDTSGRDFTSLVAKIAAKSPDAVFFAGGANAGAVRLWQQLYTALPHVKLLGSSAVAVPAFTSQLGASGANTYLTTPTLASRLYPPAAQRLFREYRQRFGEAATPYALYGYEAMQDVLLAIRNAGSHGNDRASVVAQFFRIRGRDSVLGRYSVAPSGDTTLSDFGVDRVVAGRPVFNRELHVAPAGA
jgi:branched-chain amino acid transport system substrate-binding protein